MRNRQPVIGSGWIPMTQPAKPTSRVPAWLIREPLIFGVLLLAALMTGVLSHPLGLVAVVAVRGLLGEVSNLRTERRTIRTLLGWVGVAFVAAIITAAGAVPQITAPPLKAPVKVEATQTDQLEGIRKSAAGIWERASAGWSDFGKPTPKGDR
jgi:hypothetical protein